MRRKIGLPGCRARNVEGQIRDRGYVPTMAKLSRSKFSVSKRGIFRVSMMYESAQTCHFIDVDPVRPHAGIVSLGENMA